VLLLVEFSDLIFAVDSIPAIFAVTKDPFIVYTSNVFAILGLRSLYFALAGVMDKFHYLKIGLGVVLAFVGVKMLLAHTAWKIDTLVSLSVVVAILTVSILWSLLRPKKVKLPAAGMDAGVLEKGTVASPVPRGSDSCRT
jgi:tellurite resistance protein TerC